MKRQNSVFVSGKPIVAKAIRVASYLSLCALEPSIAASPPGKEPNLVDALHVAGRFLNDWQMRNAPDALSFVSTGMENRVGVSRLESELVGLSNPHHLSFEIGPGSVTRSKARFSIQLYEGYTGEKQPSVPARGVIALVRDKLGKWKVDQLILKKVASKPRKRDQRAASYSLALARVDSYLTRLLETDSVTGSPSVDAYQVWEGTAHGSREYRFTTVLYQHHPNWQPYKATTIVSVRQSRDGKWNVVTHAQPTGSARPS